MSRPILEMKNLSKEYYGNRVLKGISFDVMPGEIHCLAGENGAGKSTLMNILFGMPVIHQTGGYQGEFFVDGEKAEIKTPQDALKYGIGMVHQEFMLIPGFTVAENIKLNREPLNHNFISRIFGKSLMSIDADKMTSDSEQALATIGVDLPVDSRVAGLPVGYMQFIEIAREIDKSNVRLLVFDEPTAVLTESEADTLLKAIKVLADKGIGILFITHRLDEVMDVSNRVTIIRDGELVKTLTTKKTSVVDIATAMVGRVIDKIERPVQVNNEKVVVSLKDFKVEMPGELVKGIDLQIKAGEIFGIGGLAGQGKVGIANGIMGIYPAYGEVLIEDQPLKLADPKASMAAGLGFVSEDRRGVGLLLSMAIENNIVIPAINNFGMFLKKYLFFTQLNTKAVKDNADKYIKDLDIRCTGPSQTVRRLSGGNQQKVCIARALTLNPKILFVSEPTRGIDIGAKKLVLDTLIKLNSELKMTIIMTSSELAELRSVCDRIAIVSEGKLAGILESDAPDADFGLLMSGVKKERIS